MATWLDLTLTPNRSLDRRHARWLICGVGAVFLIGGARLLALGAWPVLPFMALDLALLGWALAASYRSGRAVEHVRLAGDELSVAKISAAGAERRFALEPWFARVEVEALAADDNRLWLRSRGRAVRVGDFLSPPERAAVGAAIDAGLARYRRG